MNTINNKVFTEMLYSYPLLSFRIYMIDFSQHPQQTSWIILRDLL